MEGKDTARRFAESVIPGEPRDFAPLHKPAHLWYSLTRKSVASRDAGEKKGNKSMANRELKSRMKNLLMFLPNMMVLCGKLMVDKRVPVTERALFAAAVIYAIIPFDFIPDMIPFVVQLDDLF